MFDGFAIPWYTRSRIVSSQSKVKIAQVKVKPEYSNMNYNNYRL